MSVKCVSMECVSVKCECKVWCGGMCSVGCSARCSISRVVICET